MAGEVANWTVFDRHKKANGSAPPPIGTESAQLEEMLMFICLNYTQPQIYIHTYIGTFGWTRKNAIINDTPRTCTCFETKRKSSSASKTTWRSIATCGSTRRKPIPFHRISSPSSCWPIITMSSHMLSIDIFQSLAMFIIPYNFSIPASSTNQSRPVPSHIPSHWHRVRPQGMCQPIITFNPSPLPRNYLITLFYIIRQFGCTDRSGEYSTPCNDNCPEAQGLWDAQQGNVF